MPNESLGKVNNTSPNGILRSGIMRIGLTDTSMHIQYSTASYRLEISCSKNMDGKCMISWKLSSWMESFTHIISLETLTGESFKQLEERLLQQLKSIEKDSHALQVICRDWTSMFSSVELDEIMVSLRDLSTSMKRITLDLKVRLIGEVL